MGVRNSQTFRQDTKRQMTELSALRAIAVERRPALASIVADRIRDAIISGELALGEAVSEEKLATRLGVSRTPVREALTSLQLQGLISIQPQRGSFVFQPSEKDLVEICDYRALLEKHAMRLAMTHHPRETIERLIAADKAMHAAERSGNDSAASNADGAYHEALVHYSDSALLQQAYTLVSGRLGAIRHFARRSSGTRSYSNAQHRQIIVALQAGDITTAEQVLDLHINNMRAHYAEAKKAAADAISDPR